MGTRGELRPANEAQPHSTSRRRRRFRLSDLEAPAFQRRGGVLIPLPPAPPVQPLDRADEWYVPAELEP